MGQETRCTAWIDGAETEGRALLESDELLFRGETRLNVHLRDVTAVSVQDGRLAIEHPGGSAVFALGTAAERWAEKIRNPRTLLDKLGVTAASRVAVLEVSDEEFLRDLRARAATVSLSTADGFLLGSAYPTGALAPPLDDACLDLIFIGVQSSSDLRHLAALPTRTARNGAVWIVHPKGRRDLRDVDVLAAGRATGLVDNKVARFSETHSALRFVIPRPRR